MAIHAHPDPHAPPTDTLYLPELRDFIGRDVIITVNAIGEPSDRADKTDEHQPAPHPETDLRNDR